MRKFKNLSKGEKFEYIAILLLYPLFLLFRSLGKGIKLFGTKKRQLTASVLAAAIVLTMIPAMSFAALAGSSTPTSVKVGGIEMALGKTSYLLKTEDSEMYNTSYTVTTNNSEYSNWYAKYYPTTGQLFLRNYSFDKEQSGIVANGDLTITLYGNNRLNSGNPYGIKTDGNMKINGSGALYVGATNRAPVFSAGGNISIDGTATKVVAKSTYGCVFDTNGDISIGSSSTVAVGVYSGYISRNAPRIFGSQTVVASRNFDGHNPETKYNSDPGMYRGYKYLTVMPQGSALVSDTATLQAAAQDPNCKTINVVAFNDYKKDLWSVALTAPAVFNHDVEVIMYGFKDFTRADNYRGELLVIGNGTDSPKVTFNSVHLYGSQKIGSNSALIVKSGTLTFENTSVVQRFDSDYSYNGTGVRVEENGNLILRGKDVEFIFNYKGNKGGAIYNAGSLTIENASIHYNGANEGGGIYNVGKLTLGSGNIDVYDNWNSENKRNNIKLGNSYLIKAPNTFSTKHKVGITPFKPASLTYSAPVAETSSNYYTDKFVSDVLGAKPIFNENSKQIRLTVTHAHCICGATHNDIGDHTTEETNYYEEWTKNDSLPQEAGYYYLTKNVYLPEPNTSAFNGDTRKLADGVVICLNSFNIYAKHSREVLYQSGGKSALTNCKPSFGGVVSHDPSIDKTNSNCGINVSYHGELSLYNIIVKNNHSGTKQTAGGGIYASTGTVNLYNCTVKDNSTSEKGGGIGAVYGSNVSIYGGEISGNTSNERAGGIYVGSNTTVNIEGTTINNNTAGGTGGGVYGDNNSTVNINGATISYNKAATNTNNAASGAGGVYGIGSSKISINGSTIESNNTGGSGGGIYFNRYGSSNGKISVTDTTVRYNYARYQGGGICAMSNIDIGGNMTVTNNYIGNGDASKRYKDGIYVHSANSYTVNVNSELTGGKIGIYAYASKYPVVAVKGANGYKLTQSDFEKFEALSVSNSFEVAMKDEGIVFKKKLKELKVEDVTVTLPVGGTYDGYARHATVTKNTGIDCGDLSISYYDENGKKLAYPPVDAGTYTFKVTAQENSVYNAAELSSPDWKFTILPKNVYRYDLTVDELESGKAVCYNVNGAVPESVTLRLKSSNIRLEEGKDYTISYENNKSVGTASMKLQFMGNYKGLCNFSYKVDYGTASDSMYASSIQENENGWYNNNVTFTANSGYEIGTTPDSFSSQVTFTNDELFDCFYVKAANGNVYKKVISIDKTAPVVTLDVQKNKFTSFINKITFGLFFKETISVSIESSDNLSGIAKTEYQIVENESDYDVNGTWGAGKFFKMSNKQKFIVYARVTDKAGNVTIVNSTGTVIYSESTAPTTAGTFDKKVGSEADVNLEFTLNGNTVNTVKHGNTMLTNGTDYTVNGNIVTVKKEYLKNFEAGTTQKFTVTFNPMGVQTDKVNLSADCSINIIDTTHKHTPQHHSGTAATCTTGGVVEYWSCSGCNKLFSDSACTNEITETAIAPIAHRNAVKKQAVAETCMEKGNKAYYECPDCHKYFAADDNGDLEANSAYSNASAFDIKEHGHSFTEKVINDAHLKSDATCEKPAVYYYDCIYCDTVSTDTKDTFENGNPLGHEFNKKVIDKAHLKNDASCLESAEYYYGCVRCDEIGSESFINGDPLGHNFTEKVTDKAHLKTPATCTTAAVYYYDCSRCDKISGQDTFDGSALGHDYSVKNADEAHLISAATCTSPAIYSCECSRCKDKSTTVTFKNGDVIPHDFGEETETKAPAVGKNGEKSARCKNCGFTKITSIPALTLDFASNDAQLFSKGNDSKLVVELNNTVTESDIEVYVGKTQVPSGMFYLSNDGKTIVLKKKFLNTLEKGEYTLNVKSPSGKISKTFVVDAVSEDIENASKGSKNEQNGGGSQGISKTEVKSPKTAEDKNASLWILLLCTLSGAAAMVTVLRKRLTNR